LYLGADEYKFIGPGRRLDGLATAVELVELESKALEVPRERIICLGTSMGGVLALMTGLSYGAGRIVVGATPFRVGSALKRFIHKERLSGAKKQTPWLIELAKSDEGGDPVEFLDRTIFDLAARCAHPCRVDVLISPRDFAASSAAEFAERAAGNPLLEVALHQSEYVRHADVGDAFYPFLRELLARGSV